MPPEGCHTHTPPHPKRTVQCPQTLLAPGAARLSSVYKLGNLSVPKPSLPWHQPGFRWLAQETWMLALGRATLAKGSAAGTRVRRKRRGRKGRDYCLGPQWTAMACKILIWSSGHRVWATLTYILTVFLRYITFRNVFCALLSKNDRQLYMFLFFHLYFRGFMRGLTN